MFKIKIKDSPFDSFLNIFNFINNYLLLKNHTNNQDINMDVQHQTI